jgi:flagella basal body P-ring formation protein FlgA
MSPVADLPPIEEAVIAALSEMVAESCSASQVEIHHLGIRKEVLANGASFRWTGNACRSNPRLNLSIVRESGEATNLVVQPALTIWMQVPVAAKDIQTGQLVYPVRGLVKLSSLSGTVVPAGGEARVPIAAGKPITTMNVREPYDARVGNTVTLQVIRGPITLTTPGKLMSNARIGDKVRVVNHHNQTVMTGTLLSPDNVQIQ